ncbi:Rpn family recombination-promoting nuclease/putative transposase [Ligilactobacillus agilis]|uniref:Rpn family recombination-promoting nuclease/putative transposase n=1 Tax=Ligilactobacillus agilis TaxID=1601 RepID=A0A9Q9J457_9LACO|nr:Rpn family recombination-promoting nuclease/putative transposase [Ligilactobacillus agilis]UXC63550.1 Rpn family recombination-promoting nuclease/putative transposase [Ligilactobacillus agilis]UXC65548.1 Rpn family recombination-promoting nuclease/putative transposase [Ligilactobacillus agilis]
MVSKQKIRRKLAQADFTDDVMFELVMSQLEICRKFLKAVLPKLDFTKIKVVDQSHLKTDYLSKAGRLDIHCTDAYGNQFDIELQMTNEHNVAQRAKYYHALMTNHMLTAGEDYQSLKETYVIFLCPFNPLATEQQRAVGHYQMISEEGDYLNDGTHTLILNASGDWEGVSDELKGIFQLVLRQPVSHGQLGAQIMNKIDEIKHSKTGGRKYMELTEAFWQDARDEGKKAGIKIGERRGKKQGADETIIKLIPDLVALTNDRQAVIKILMNKMNLSQAQAESYYKRAMEPTKK